MTKEAILCEGIDCAWCTDANCSKEKNRLKAVEASAKESSQAWKSKTFEIELSYIKEPLIKELAVSLIEKLPDYFFSVAASSTGKYHPSYTSGEGGLVRHTKAAVRIAHELMRLELYSEINKYHDCILLALLLHDGFKHGIPEEDGSYSKYTQSTHPKICADWLQSLTQTSEFCNAAHTLYFVASLILTHMGQWNLEYSTGIVFAPKPETTWQMFVHLCDYLASRKCLEMNFDIPFVDPY